MRRRTFLAAASVAATWPLYARAQQPTPVIGFLSAASASSYADRLEAFRRGLADAGFAEGHNVNIEYRWADDRIERLPELAADLVRRRVSVIAALGGTPVTLAAKAVTNEIPIVFYMGVDPVERGVVPRLSSPGGNLTGVNSLALELVPKRIELLHELAPRTTSLAMLVNPANESSASKTVALGQATAATFSMETHVLRATGETDLEDAFATAARLPSAAMVVASDAFFNNRSERLAALSIKHSLPTAFQYREFAAAGGLLSYGGSRTAPFLIAGGYAGRILKGARPAEFPCSS